MRTKLVSRIPKIMVESRVKTAGIVQATAQAVERDAKSFVPKDTLALHDSIQAEVEDGGMSAKVNAGSGGAFYAHMVEYGTTKTVARPFMGPAATQNEGLFVAALKRIVR